MQSSISITCATRSPDAIRVRRARPLISSALCALLHLTCAHATAAPRDDAAHKLKTTERQRATTLAAQAKAAEKVKAAQARADAIAAQTIQAADRLRALDAAVQTEAGRLRDARNQQDIAAGWAGAREAAIAAMLPLMLRLSRSPVETILAAPMPSGQALEGLLAAHGLAAELASDIRALRADQTREAALARTVSDRAAALTAQRSRQTEAQAALQRQFGQAEARETEAEKQQETASRTAADLAAQAANLRDAIAAMDRAEQLQARRGAAKPQAGPGLALAAGHAPVAGAVLRGWGAAAEDGPATGITFAASPNAIVTSPCTGKIAFAAPFRSYGRLMIVECGRGYDFVLAGLDRVDAAIGHAVRRGEPVGEMPPAGAVKSGLYLELRLNGRPVDPAPFLNAKA